MLAVYKRRTNIFVGLGLALQLAGRLLNLPPTISIMLVIVGGALFIVGCIAYAQGKGRSGVWGLAGFFSIFGLILLALLHDRHPEPE